jgi:hypothetical protein
MSADVVSIRRKFKVLSGVLNERTRRLWAASEAREIGRRGIARVAEATGMARNTIVAGMKELEASAREVSGKAGRLRVRRPGGGRKKVTETSPGLLEALESLVEPLTRGDPESPLRWTCKSTAALANELQRQGYSIGARTVAKCLAGLRYSLQANRKTKEGSSHPDRNAQFEHINAMADAWQKRRQPVVSVDTKKKELVGEYKNAGKTWRPVGEPVAVNVHDFANPELGKVVPYGVYDLALNNGWVSVGIDHDTAEFACETIRRWWRRMGKASYPHAKELLILADGGGSNGSRSRLWKLSLQALADETGLALSVCHFPPGTSKWNKIEHRMFSSITENWRGQPLVSREVVVNLIANTRTRAGLKVRAALDKRTYQTGKKVSAQEMSKIHLQLDKFHGDWNYTIEPHKR